MTIAFSQFINCSSIYGGGAVAATAFVCYGLAAPFSTSVYIADSSFTQCSSDGSGGAVFAASQSAMLNVMYSTFDSCKSNGMGGALAAFTGAVARVTGSMFSGNSASGHGGGAVYVQYAQLTLHGVVAYDNIAFAGGGGALYWQNLLPPIIVPWCREGTFPDPDFECTPARCANSCLPCIAGTYQSSIGVETNESCTFCAAGTFSSSPGATVCTTCEQGKFSSAVCVQMVRSQVQCRLHHAPFVAWALFPASKVALYAFHVFLVTIRHRLDQVIRATVYLVLLARLLSVQLLHRAILAVLAYSQGRILANAPHALLVPSHPHLNLLLVGYAALDRIRFRERRCVKNACREHIPQKLGQPI